MTRNGLFRLFVCLIMVTALFQLFGFIYSLYAYNDKLDFGISSNIDALLIYSAYLIAPFFLIKFIRSGKEISRVHFLLSLLASIFLPYFAIVQHVIEDPLTARFLGLLISFPLSLGLAFLTLIELIKSK